MPDPLILFRDYYIDGDGRWVFTADFLLRRGTCCGSGCRHCPYEKRCGGDALADRPADQSADPNADAAKVRVTR